MVSTDTALLSPDAVDEQLQRYSEIFGGLRAEYLREEVFELFTKPTYWPELLSGRPCLLVGGRGTGKTTVLRGLSYKGQLRLGPRNIEDWTFVGLYWRVDTSVVRAFRGSSLPESEWIRLFSHYVNLVLTQLLVEFLLWLKAEGYASDEGLFNRAWTRGTRSLGLPSSSSLDDMMNDLEDALYDFESLINNRIDELIDYQSSILGRPLQALLESFRESSLLGDKPFYFLIDEYENLDNYQQRVINTLIKHAGDYPYTFKIGMRELGHRERSTINPNEQLIEPADYAYIDIAERLKGEGFGSFARKVCEGRLDKVRGPASLESISDIFPALTEAEEANLLGVQDRIREIRGELERNEATSEELAAFDRLPSLSAYLVQYWSESKGEPLVETLKFAIGAPIRWQTRLSNYQHAMLFTIREGKRGVNKYYAGWDTYVILADGNIRYLLQLVTDALQAHARDRKDLQTPVSSSVQTAAAQAVGQRIVQQLQGVSADGADLTRLVLGLGRIFQVMAATPRGHAPEVSQFRVSLSAAEDDVREVDELLEAAVMHLAVRRFPGDKMAKASGETKNFDYQLHPIFAPFFNFSYRSKRRLILTIPDLLGLLKDPSKAISAVLRRRGSTTPEVDLPVQLSLFRDYFGESAS